MSILSEIVSEVMDHSSFREGSKIQFEMIANGGAILTLEKFNDLAWVGSIILSHPDHYYELDKTSDGATFIINVFDENDKVANLSTSDIKKAISNSGYDSSDVKESEFIKFTTRGEAVYKVATANEEFKLYVTERDGKFYGEY